MLWRVWSVPLRLRLRGVRHASHAASAFAQLQQLQRLIREASAINSVNEKWQILAEQRSLLPILERIYDPHTSFHVRSASVRKYLAETPPPDASEESPPATLEDLLDVLAARERTGKAALRTIAAFLYTHGAVGKGAPRGMLEAFCRCLDRNLQSGFSHKLLEQALGVGTVRRAGTETDDTIPGLHYPFSVALARTVETEKLQGLPWGRAPDGAANWYASRKLDGVRCIVVIDLAFPRAGPPQITHVYTASRTGKPLHSLSLFREQLGEELRQCTPFQEAVRTMCMQGRRSPLRRVVLDGELCVWAQAEAKHDGVPSVDGSSPPAAPDDYRAIVSAVRRKNGAPLRHARYYPFDLLTYEEFAHWDEPGRRAPLPFAARASMLQAIAAWCAEKRPEGPLHPLAQEPTYDAASAVRQVERAIQQGWEGIVLRENRAYEGKRTNSMLKLKQTQDAEYVVQDVEIATMRLALHGQFALRRALAAVVIFHHGVRVAVGSGFTAEQRVAYAEDPAAILGRVVTVSYASESASLHRMRPDGGEGGRSLRFPRVKQVFGAERDV